MQGCQTYSLGTLAIFLLADGTFILEKDRLHIEHIKMLHRVAVVGARRTLLYVVGTHPSWLNRMERQPLVDLNKETPDTKSGSNNVSVLQAVRKRQSALPQSETLFVPWEERKKELVYFSGAKTQFPHIVRSLFSKSGSGALWTCVMFASMFSRTIGLYVTRHAGGERGGEGRCP